VADNQLTNTQKLTEYINTIVKVINDLNQANDIKNAKTHVANRLNNLKGTMIDDNDIIAAANNIENITGKFNLRG
ncbi:11101_t:CDS:1, partial [Gigaspora rosea]